MEQTKKAIIVRQLRQLWLRSRERAEALKRAGYKCQSCGVKQSTAKGKEQKIQVHHKQGICNWDAVIELIRKEILCDVELLQVLCPECHNKEENTKQ